ncbi:MAG: T9SS type A sorting domain-containing protein [Bacteroidales bacterium]|nr:T9SS type A sorting domain-containing protein [Bacteroidales bacterium]
MKTARIIEIAFKVTLVLFVLLAGGVQAQEHGFRWGKWQEGQRTQDGALKDIVFASYVDSIGNTYVWGEYGQNARLGEYGPYICPLDEYGYDPQHRPGSGFQLGTFLAKIDSAGTVMWCKSAGAAFHGLTAAWNSMVVKDNKITVACYVTYSSHWLYFFDTIFTFSSDFSDARSGMYVYFVTFDMDGNMLEYHCIQLFGFLSSSPGGFFGPCSFFSHRGGNSFTIDNEGNIHVFTGGSWVTEDSLHKAYILVDEDTNRRYPLNPKTIGGEYLALSLYMKLDREWNLVSSRYLIDSIDGWTRSAGHDACYASLEPKKVIAEDDGIYAWCTFRCDDFLFEPDSFLVKAFLDSAHYLWIDNKRDFKILPCLIKFNLDGSVAWIRQLYAIGRPNMASHYSDMGCIALDEDYVYSYFNSTNWCRVFADSAHTQEIVGHLLDYGFVVAYDRATGDYIDYYLFDTINRNWSLDNSLALIGDELVQNVHFFFLHYKEILKINKHTKEVTRSFPIYNRGAPSAQGTKCMAASPYGWTIRVEVGEVPMVGDSIFIGNYQDALVYAFFYDSTLDLHRPSPCPAVDSLWCSSTMGHDVALSWQGPDLPQYELAFVPQGDSWDDATLVVVADTTTTLTLPSDQCYKVRIRGLCDGNRRAHSPWSDSLAICPEVGIDNVASGALLSLSPNPSGGVVQILGLEDDNASVEILDIDGRLLLSFENTTSLDLSSIPAGIYIVKVMTKGNRYEYLKLIKH